MLDRSLSERSGLLAARVDALATALQESGVDADAASRLLAAASSAVLQALTLDLLFDPAEPVAPPAAPAVEPEATPAEPDVPLAA
jgi:hypothetical protein